MTYRRVSSFKIMEDYKKTCKLLKTVITVAYNMQHTDNDDAIDIDYHREFDFINNSQSFNKETIKSKLTTRERNEIFRLIQHQKWHHLWCYAWNLYYKYNNKYKEYNKRMDVLFMTIEDKNIFYA